jgi:two-component system cell cycle sensor histidine kinase/response regulator CckA
MPDINVPSAATTDTKQIVVLMVDDEPAQRQLFAFALRREGYFVLEARNGAEALDVAERAGHIDLVVSDVMMPLMKGPEMATRLRERYPNVRVLFVSGFLIEEDLGRDAHVMQKPFVRKDLLKSVVDIIGPARTTPPAADRQART